MTAERSPKEVFDDHLALALEGRVEADLERNYGPDVVFLWREGVEHGLDGARRLAALLDDELPAVRFEYVTRLVAGEFAFLEWTAVSPNAVVRDGADSYVIRDGRIVAQTIHYTVEVAQRSPVDE